MPAEPAALVADRFVRQLRFASFDFAELLVGLKTNSMARIGENRSVSSVCHRR